MKNNKLNDKYTLYCQIGDDMNLIEKLHDEKQAQTILYPYRSAIRVIKAKLESIDDELKCTNGYSPIHMIQSRIKSTDSLLEKMQRKQFNIEESQLQYIYDIAGLRVICHYINDIQYISQLLVMHQDIHLIKKSNYIDYPKQSGYRSLHLIVEVPIYLKAGVRRIPVEIQLRTIAMDFWASLEHELLYKNHDEICEDLKERLKLCSQQMAQTDLEMQKIYQEIEK